MLTSLENTARLLKQVDNITIIAHRKPDGDTLGSAFALLYGLEQLGKTARVICDDGYPEKYATIVGPGYTPKIFHQQFVVAVDIADLQLFGTCRDQYEGKVDLCIDHHPSNSHYAKKLLLDAASASTCEIIYKVLQQLAVQFTPQIASCIYLGISTDTGCFRFTNTSASSHQAAAELISFGADYTTINRLMFETVSRQRMQVESRAKASIEYYCDGALAVMYITPEMLENTDVTEYDMDGFSAIPRQIEGVEVGVTIREQAEGECRISMRSCQEVDVSQVCRSLGGGGHKRAAGCTLQGTRVDALAVLLKTLTPYFTA